MSVIVKEERGAALVTVLLFMVLTFILITSMLTVTGNEVVISSLQRDGVRAMDLAQAGLQEAVRRMEEGRPYAQGFTSSLQSSVPGSTITVTTFRRHVGTNSAYQEFQSTARIGRSTRRLSMLVLQRMISFPPNITFAASVIEQGSADINCGDAYARTFIQYKSDPNNVTPRCPSQPAVPPPPPTLTYAGWRISMCTLPDGPCAGGAVPPCYQAPCAADPDADTSKWYPATRWAEPITTAVGQELEAMKSNCTPPAGTVTGKLANEVDVVGIPQYGFDTDDPDGAVPPQAMIPGVLPCGLPYKLELESFQKEDGTLVPGGRLIKKVAFEHWFAVYWRFDETQMTYVKRNGSPCSDAYCLNGVEPNFADNQKFGAVPPFPEIDTVNANYQCKVSGGGVISSLPLTCAEPPSTTSDLGCKYPQMSCSPAEDRPVLTVFGLGDWTINANLKGHGTIVVDGNLTVNGDFEYWGTIVVNGTLTLGAGDATVHGGLVADSTLKISGNIKVEGGGTITNVPTGRSIVTGRGWWER